MDEQIVKNTEKKELHPAVRIMLKLLFFVCFVGVAFTFIFGLHRYHGNNMFPKLEDGDLCLYYRLEKPYLEDVVLYKIDNTLHIGRVSAIEGQTVDFMKNGSYVIDGNLPIETLPFETQKDTSSDVQYPIVLNENEYFVLNDYRSNMDDSRKYGVINKKDIIGKVKFIFRRRGI